MKYWVRLDKERIMANYDEDDLMNGSSMESIYLIRQLRFYIDQGDVAFLMDEQDLLFGQGKVMMRDHLDRGVYVPCKIIISASSESALVMGV